MRLQAAFRGAWRRRRARVHSSRRQPCLAARLGSGISDGGWRKGRSGSDSYRGKQSDPDRGFRLQRAVTIGQFRREKCPVVTGVSDPKGGQDQTLFDLAPIESPAQTPAKTPAETPAPNARAGREPLNPRIREDPPNPPEGGSPPGSILDRGDVRHCSRPQAPSSGADRPRRGPPRPRTPRRRRPQRLGADPQARSASSSATSMFEIWLEPLELIAIDPGGALVIDAPPITFSWLQHRYGRVLARCAEERRHATAVRRGAPNARRSLATSRAPRLSCRAVHINQQEVS